MGIGLIFTVLLVAGIILLLQGSGSGRGLFGPHVTEAAPVETPLEILKKRYARGEIDTAEYKARRSELQ